MSTSKIRSIIERLPITSPELIRLRNAGCITFDKQVFVIVDCLLELREALRESETATEQVDWRSMETAPQDGSDVLLLIPNSGNPEKGFHRVVGMFDTDSKQWECSWTHHDYDYPSETWPPQGWTPLPPVPDSPLEPTTERSDWQCLCGQFGMESETRCRNCEQPRATQNGEPKP